MALEECVCLLLSIVEFLLKIVYAIVSCIIIIIRLLLQHIHYIAMTESPKKRKRNSPPQQTKTSAIRSVIDANWQQFLTGGLLMDKKTENPVTENNNSHFTGTFRRSRKKKSHNLKTSNLVENNLKTLAIGTDDVVKDCSSNQVEMLTIDNKLASKENKLTKFIAMDCEMVGIGYDGNDHMLARISLVNKFGDCIYDKFVKPQEDVVDYRTSVSGVRKEDMLNGEDFKIVQKEVAEILKGRIIVGHSLKNDLSVLFLSHPKRNIRDTAKYKPFRKITKGSTPSLKRLAKEILGIDIQGKEHCSIEDARAAMQLYCTVSKKWENMMKEKRGGRKISE